MKQEKTLAKALVTEGIVSFPGIFSPEELCTINAAVDPLFAGRAHEKRSYVEPDEMQNLGLFPILFSERMKSVLFSIIPDPVLYHFHIYEIAGNNTRSHIFGGEMQGWHGDEDSEFSLIEPTHVSLFVYLTDVGPTNGPFEFVPNHQPLKWLKNGTPYISVQGKAGFSFAWNRPFFHRASPNQEPRRRRLLKISIQRNHFPSIHVKNENFQAVLKKIPAGDPEMDLLLGRYQGKTAPQLDRRPDPSFESLATNNTLAIDKFALFFVQLRRSLRRFKRKLKRSFKQKEVASAY